MILLRLQLVLVLCLVQFSLNAQLYTFRNYNHRDGLAMEATLSAAQDDRGYLWIGTDGAGLMRYDGYRFQEIKSRRNNQQHHVSSVFPAADGTVYFTSMYSGLYRYRDHDFELIRKSDPGTSECVQVSMTDTTLIMVCHKAILLVSPNGKVYKRQNLAEGYRLEIYQTLKIPQGVLLFTNKGNYFIKSGKIIPFKKWCGDRLPKTFSAGFATFSNGNLTLYNRSANQSYRLVIRNNGSVFNVKKAISNISAGALNGEVRKVCERQGLAYLMTDSEAFYHLREGKISAVAPNYSGNLGEPEGMTIDKNGDLWINSSRGIFKVSVEPFTQVKLSSLYENRGIVVIHRSADKRVILGTAEKKIHIFPLYGNGPELTFPYQAYQVCEIPQGLFIATDIGILQLKGNTLVPVNLPEQKGKSITLLHWDGDHFWYSVRGEGVIRYDFETGNHELFKKLTTAFPDYFYTAQNNFDHTLVFFGTNDGIYRYNKKNGRLRLVSGFSSLGAYSGVSTRDKFGTCWFTLDKGLAGITKEGEYVTISDPALLPSTLFYTLSSDNFGNLLAGTNKGINVIEVDRNGNVVHQNNYSFLEGFGGYETHMRSQFQAGNSSYVGTIEGLYLINTEILRSYPAPPQPVILFGSENDRGELVQYRDKLIYSFKCLLPKSKAVMFSYRIRGYKEKWSDFSFAKEVELPELPNGEYTLEVRSSYDGITVSPVATYAIAVDLPFWRSKWLIVVLLVVLALANIVYLEWTKSYASNHIFDTKEVMVDVRLIPRIIVFGFLMNALMLFVAPMFDRSLKDLTDLNILSSGTYFILVLISYFYKSGRAGRLRMTRIFYLAFTLFMAEYFYLVFQTNVHPFPLFAIVLSTSVIPFIISDIRFVLVITILQLLTATTMLLWLENTVYNEILFIAAILISGAITVMATYLRNASLEKLIFISGIINKGNVLAISFDRQGIINYCSENMIEFFATDASAVTGKQLSILNPFVAESRMRSINLSEEFEDGKIFLVPMFNRENEVRWMEWSCKYINESVRVIIGHDVTEKMTLSIMYESLVENAQDLIYHTDIFSNFVFANERSVQLFGYRHETIIGKNALQLVAPDYRDQVKHFYEEQFRNRLPHTYLEFPIKSKDGRVFWVGQNVTMIYEPGSRKRVSGFIALARDITEKRANDLLIEQQNKDITSSINSAKRIQFNLLPDTGVFNRYFGQSFTLFRPKDIVSGDFYWVEQVDEKLIVVLADCTGHGVPGAFMTILGINLLNQIVRERKQYKPKVILDQLNNELDGILRRKEGEVLFETIEALVCVFDTNELCFASSGVALIHSKEEDLMVYRHTRTGDGESANYKEICLDFTEKDTFYLLTDGYQKQFGSIRNKKFGFKRILELLQNVRIESMPLQKKYFENAWKNWSDQHEQTDDITVIGLTGYLPLNASSGEPDNIQEETK